MSGTICPACKFSLDEHSLSQELNCLNSVLLKIKNSEGHRFDPKPSELTQAKGSDTNV